MPALVSNAIADITKVVHDLKVDRDTWRAVAAQYKKAFYVQTARFEELQSICIATQLELDNERAQRRRYHDGASSDPTEPLPMIDGAGDSLSVKSFGTATIFSNRVGDQGVPVAPHDLILNPIFERVQQPLTERNFGTARAELDRLLQGPLSTKARIEGLLLKVNILRASGTDETYNALAACTEALELCTRLSKSDALHARVQCYHAVLLHQLHMLENAQDGTTYESPECSPYDELRDRRNTWEHTVKMRQAAKRRSGFDECRSAIEAVLVGWDTGGEVSIIHQGGGSVDNLAEVSASHELPASIARSY